MASAALTLLTSLLWLKFASCTFEFHDMESVKDIAIAVVEDFQLGCLVILKPSNASAHQNELLDRLTTSLAKGETGRRDIRYRQVMAYDLQDYMAWYTEESRVMAGSCIIWLNIVIVSETTRDQLTQVSQSFVFTQSVWLVFSNSSMDKYLQGVNLWFNSAVLVVQPDTADSVSLWETFRVRSDFPVQRSLRATWSKQGGMRLLGGSQRIRRHDMQGLVLRVGSNENWPFSSYVRGQAGKSRVIDGFFPIIWFELETALNFTSNFVRSDDENFGVKIGDNWTGHIGMVQRGEIEAILAELDYTKSRLELLANLLPILHSGMQVYTKRDGYNRLWGAVFQPFDSGFWIALLIWIVFGATCVHVSNLIAVQHGLELPSLDQTCFIHRAYFIVQTLSFQGCCRVPRIWSARILFLTCYLMAAVVLPSYSASLISHLTKATPALPFDALEGMLATDYRLIVQEATAVDEYFAVTRNPTLTAIRKQAVIVSYDEAFAYVCTHRKTALLVSERTMASKRMDGQVPCKVNHHPHPVFRVYQSIALAKRSPYLTSFNFHFLRMRESGVISRHEQKYMPKQGKPQLSPFSYVYIMDVATIFVFLIAMYFIALLILCAEIYCFKKGKLQI